MQTMEELHRVSHRSRFLRSINACCCASRFYHNHGVVQSERTRSNPFAGSNTTGAAAEALGRKWISVEANPDYIKGPRGRFTVRKGRAANRV